jgi:hypothetical protein
MEECTIKSPLAGDFAFLLPETIASTSWVMITRHQGSARIFDTYDQAEQYGAQLERLLAQGLVPAMRIEQESPALRPDHCAVYLAQFRPLIRRQAKYICRAIWTIKEIK